MACSLQHLGAESTRGRQLEAQCSQLTQELAQSRTHVQEGNYKIDNFDAVKRYRDMRVVRKRKRETLLPSLVHVYSPTEGGRFETSRSPLLQGEG